MRQPFSEHHVLDDGKPAGGVSLATGVEIHWQDGPLAVDGTRIDPNGAFVETVLEMVQGRLAHYQSTQFASPHNAEAMAFIGRALAALQARTADREARGVEGTHQL